MREKVIAAHAELPSLCEHIHLPLQSGSSRILKAMRRTYDRDRYMQRVEMIRDDVPDCAITTDIIVGFPGETEDDFRETLEVVEEVGYDSAFTFIFSPRRGTEAADAARPAAARRQAGAHGAAGRARPAARARAQPAASWAPTQEVLVEGPSRTDPARLRGRTRHNKTVNFTGLARAGRAGRRARSRARPSTTLAGRGATALARLPEPLDRDLRADRGRQDRGRDRARRAAARARRAAGRRVGRRDPGLRGARHAGREALARAAGAARAPADLVRPDRPGVQRRASSPSARTPRSTRLLDEGATPIVVGGTGLYLRAALTELDLKPPPDARRCASRSSASSAELGHGALHARLRPASAAAVHPERPQADRARARAGAHGGAAAPRLRPALVGAACGRPAALFGLVDGPRRARGAHPPRGPRRCSAAGARRGGRVGARAGRLPDGAQGARLQGDRGAPARARSSSTRPARCSSGATSPTSKRQLTWMRKLAGVEMIDRTRLERSAEAARGDSLERLDRLPRRRGHAASRSGRRSATTT